MLLKILILFGITLIPAFELRASIPYGILSGGLNLPFGIHVQGMNEPWYLVFIICVISNFVLGLLLYPFYDKFLHLLEKIPFINKLWKKFVDRAQRKISKYVNRWGTLGVALFIAVPLPGSGSYTGILGGYLLGLDYKHCMIANAIGVTLAGIAVTIITVTGKGIFQLI